MAEFSNIELKKTYAVPQVKSRRQREREEKTIEVNERKI